MDSNRPTAQTSSSKPDASQTNRSQTNRSQTNRSQTNRSQTSATREYSAILSSAEVELAKRFDRPIGLTDVDCLSEEERRNLLLRCKVTPAAADIPTSVIIKQVLAGNSEHNKGTYDPQDITSQHTTRLMSDWVGAQFVSAAAPDADHGPHFYGGDLAQGFIIMEDLGSQHQSLVDPLLEGSEEDASTALRAFAQRLGQMHGDGMAHLDLFDKLATALHPDLADAQTEAAKVSKRGAEQPAQLEALGFAVDPAYPEELLAVTESILNPGPFLTYIHGDPCPDNNVIYPDGRLRLIDFEMGLLGHALLDITYARMITPSCWCCNRIPAPLIDAMESIYRAELSNACPAAADNDLFEAALVDVCAYWFSRTLGALPEALEKDWDWGITTYRPRIIARLESFIDIAQKTNRRPAIRTTAEGLHEELTKRWPELEPMPFYPAFQNLKAGALQDNRQQD